MKGFFKKLLLGSPSEIDKEPQYTLASRVANIKSIWNNDTDNDMGIEKIFRLILALSPFIFLGTYIKSIFGRYGLAPQELAVDFFVLIKVIFPLILLKFELTNNPILIGIMIWFLFETILYVPTLIFASDIYGRPRSYRRSMLLLFLNYMEITFAFAAIYATGVYLNRPFEHWIDPIYFSFITSATIGFGDYHPATTLGRILVSIQTIVFLIFVVVFLNFFSNKVEHKGYFDHNKDNNPD